MTWSADSSVWKGREGEGEDSLSTRKDVGDVVNGYQNAVTRPGSHQDQSGMNT